MRYARINTSIDEINNSVNELLDQWNVSERDNQEIFDKVIGLQLKKIRFMRKKTQTKVAKAINVTFQQIQKYEKGKNGISPFKILKLCEFLRVDFEYFIQPFIQRNLNFNKREKNGYDNTISQQVVER